MSAPEQSEAQVEARRESSSSSSSLSSTSNSISLIKLDELSSFGATKQARLPALIKLSPLADLNSREPPQQQPHQQLQVGPANSNSMPDFSASQLEKMAAEAAPARELQQQSLPANLQQVAAANKENAGDKQPAHQDESVDGFQVLEMDQMMSVDGPSLAPPGGKAAGAAATAGRQLSAGEQLDKSLAAASLLTRDQQQQYASNLGDSLIEMIINLRNENQDLIKALEVNNSYVKERLSEFKRAQEELKRRESQFALEKAELEHNLRKVQRQNSVLSERLKSMEAKLKDMKLEVSESLVAAHSSKASSVRGEDHLYPQLAGDDSFANSALNAEGSALATIQMDATSGELYHEGDREPAAGPAAAMDAEPQTSAAREVANMTGEQLAKRFDANKAEFLSLDDPMKQCDQLEQQLNNIGKRDYEICLLQQQLNIYRQDFRLERMAKLEAKIQIEKLKNEIDRLCLDRLGKPAAPGAPEPDSDEQDERQRYGPTPATAAADGLIGKLGHHLSRKALKSAAKAAKYASKQAHLEEKAAAALARAAAAKAAAASHFKPATATPADPPRPAAHHETPAAGEPSTGGHYHSRRHHHARGPNSHHRGARGIRGEIVSDLMSTANKAMLTGYNLASTTINSALDKLSQFEQQQAAAAADPHRPRPGVGPASAQASSQQQSKPSAPPMDSQPSMD